MFFYHDLQDNMERVEKLIKNKDHTEFDNVFGQLTNRDFFEKHKEVYSQIMNTDNEPIIDLEEYDDDKLEELIKRFHDSEDVVICDDVILIKRYIEKMRNEFRPRYSLYSCVVMGKWDSHALLEPLYMDHEGVYDYENGERRYMTSNKYEKATSEKIEDFKKTIVGFFSPMRKKENEIYLKNLFFDNDVFEADELTIETLLTFITDKHEIISRTLKVFEEENRKRLDEYYENLKNYENYNYRDEYKMLFRFDLLHRYFALDCLIVCMDIYHKILKEILLNDNSVQKPIYWASNHHETVSLEASEFSYAYKVSYGDHDIISNESKLVTNIKINKMLNILEAQNKTDKAVGLIINIIKKSRYPFYRKHLKSIQSLYEKEGDRTFLYELDLLGDPKTILMDKCPAYLKAVTVNYSAFKNDTVSLIKEIKEAENTEDLIKSANTYIKKWSNKSRFILKPEDGKKIKEHVTDAMFYRFGNIITDNGNHKIYKSTVESIYEQKQIPRAFITAMSLLTSNPEGQRVKKSVKEIFPGGYQSLILFSAMDADRFRHFSESLYKIIHSKVNPKELKLLYDKNNEFLKSIKKSSKDEEEKKLSVKKYSLIDKIIKNLVRFHTNIVLLPNNILYLTKRVDNLAHEACKMLVHSTRKVDDDSGQKTLKGRIKRAAKKFRRSEFGNTLL